MSDKLPLFRDLNADDADQEATIVESMCVNCRGNGQTRLLLTKIPFFKEVILASFSCDQCGFENNEITSGSVVPEKAVKITLKVNDRADLRRQLVKSDHTRVEIPELEFEIPSKSQKGEITTVEGVVDRIVRGLQQDQPKRREEHLEVAEKIEGFIKSLEELREFERPFTLILDDISGNSFIENPIAPKTDPNCTYEYYLRTKEQDHELGIFTQEEVTGETSILHPIKEDEYSLEEIQGEVLQFHTNCPSCGSPCETNMKMTNIPHFKEVIIMATVCDVCGNRTNEVKSGAGIEPKGVRFEVNIKNKEDLSRDVLKSETCHLEIPELDLTVGPHALGGRFTTVEGLIVAVKEQLSDPGTSHMFGDSEVPSTREGFAKFLGQIDEVLGNKLAATLVLDDPCGNSYVQSMTDDDRPDDQLKITHYDRTFEQNEELGLNDMKTEGYEKH